MLILTYNYETRCVSNALRPACYTDCYVVRLEVGALGVLSIAFAIDIYMNIKLMHTLVFATKIPIFSHFSSCLYSD